MTEGVENQEVSYLHSSYVMARSNLLVPAERKKNFTFSLSGREDPGNPIDCCFLQKSMKKGSNATIPPSPQNERGDLVVLGL